MKKIIHTTIALAFIGYVSGQSGPEWRGKVAPSLLEETSDGQSMPFIILLTQQADVSAATGLNTKDEKAAYVFQALRDKALETQRNLTAFLNQKNIRHHGLFIVNAIRTEGTQELIHSLAKRPDVKKIMGDVSLRFTEPVEWTESEVDSRSLIEWGIDMINADEVWAMGYRGQGVTVGGADTGYEWEHPALKQQYRGYLIDTDSADHNYHWHDAIHEINPLNADSLNPCGLDVHEPCDDRGHGTHTMGTMIGLDGENQIGVAPEAKWCGCRNMERGWGSPFTYLECFEWFLAPTDLKNENPDPLKSPHVINNSWSCPQVEGCDSSNWHILDMAVNNLRNAGIVVVVSAGNDGSECGSVSVPPAMYEGSLSVGATDFNDTIASFSSRGPVLADSSNRHKPNVSAPGVDVRSARLGGKYGNSSGTSMAGPHVAGMVALIISANPDLAGKVDIIEEIIELTAIPKFTEQICGDIPGTQVPNHTFGFGRIDALEAVKVAIALIPVGTGHSLESQIVSAYPNPVDDKLIIEVQNAEGDLHIALCDIHGHLLLRDEWNSERHAFFTIDFSKKPAGIYFFRIMMGEKMQVGKVVKK